MLLPVVARLTELQRLARQRRVREVAEVLQAFDVDLGQLGQLGAVVLAVLVLVEALDRHRRVELVEGPLLRNADEGAVLVEQRGLHRDPDMRVRSDRQAHGRKGHGRHDQLQDPLSHPQRILSMCKSPYAARPSVAPLPNIWKSTGRAASLWAQSAPPCRKRPAEYNSFLEAGK